MLLFKYYIIRKLKVFTRWFLITIGIIDKKIKVQSSFVFVVGCTHSGTTLITTILGRNSQVLALGNESYLFGQQYSAIKYGVKQWDMIAYQLNKSVFVEKTPKHIYELKKIFKLLPSCKVIYVIRNAEDNIASLYRNSGDFNFSINKYISDNRNAIKFENDRRLKKVFYEELVTTPEKTVRSLCSFLNIEYESQMITGGNSVFEKWGSYEGKPKPSLRSTQVTEPITNKIGKSRKILTQSEIDNIYRKLKESPLSNLALEDVVNSISR